MPDPQAPFYALWSRIVDFEPAELDELIEQREVVVIDLLRGARWLMDGHDARWMRAICQPDLWHRAREAAGLTEAEAAEVIATATDLLDDGPMAAGLLGERLAAAWPDRAPAEPGCLVRAGLLLVETPPRGLWRRDGETTVTSLDDWIGPGGPAVTGDEALADLIRMYLRGHGPASVAGLQAWSGLTGLAPVLEAMAADWELVEYTGPAGEHLYDLDGLKLSDPDLPAPVRFLAPGDHLLAVAADCARVADAECLRRLPWPGPDQSGPGGSGADRSGADRVGGVLVDGMLAATWQLADQRIRVDYLREPSASERAAVAAEAEALADFALDSVG